MDQINCWLARRAKLREDMRSMRVQPMSGIDKRVIGKDVILSKQGNEDGKFFVLNETGALIWDWIQNGGTLQEICEKMSEVYEVDPDVDLPSHVESFLKQLDERVLIIVEEN